MLFLKTYLGGGIAQPIQAVGSLLIPLAGEARWENDLSIAPMGLTNSKF